MRSETTKPTLDWHWSKWRVDQLYITELVEVVSILWEVHMSGQAQATAVTGREGGWIAGQTTCVRTAPGFGRTNDFAQP